MLKTKMRWNQTRQTVLAQNIANADTPDYKARDLKAPSFGDMLKMTASGGSLGAVTTNRLHIAGMGAAETGFEADSETSWEVTPEGNSVVLEDQMMKVAENQMDYQMATTLYSRSLGLLRTAVGRR